MTKQFRLLSLGFILAAGLPAAADNSLMVSLFAQITSGHLCADIKQADVRNSSLACATPFNRTLSQMAGPASWLLDIISFDAAVAPQIKRDRCVAQRARALAQLPSAKRNWWRANLVTAWLGRRKAKLALKFCEENFNSHVPPSVAAEDKDEAWEQWKRADKMYPLYPGDPKKQEEREAKMQAWAPVCFNADAIAALKQADQIFAYTVPVIESETLFDSVEARRDLLTNVKTGRPLSDPEILETDLRDLKMVHVKLDSALNSQLDKTISDIARERDRSATEFMAAKDTDGHYHLSPAQRQYLYEEGSLTEAVHDNFKDKNSEVVPAALACFDARYGRQPVGEMMNLAFWSAISGGAYGALLGNIRFAKTLSFATKARKSMNAGFTLATADQGIKQTWDICTKIHSPYGRQANSKSNEFEAQAASGDLPDELGFRMWDMPIDEKSTPACLDKDVKNALIQANETNSCAREIVTNGLPNLIGLPH